MTEWNLLTQQATFVGLDNYRRRAVRNPDFWHVVRNSRVFAVGPGAAQHGAGAGLALALSRPFFGVVFFRTIFFAPVVTSAVAWAIVWKFLLQGEAGFVNQMLAWVGIDGPNWLREPNWAMVAVIVTRVIKMVGLNMILYIAALQSIPRDYEEAARLEGASQLADLPDDHLAAAGADHAGHHGHHHDRLVQGVRPHLPDDQWRTGKRHAGAGLLHLPAGLQVLQRRLRLGAGDDHVRHRHGADRRAAGAAAQGTCE